MASRRVSIKLLGDAKLEYLELRRIVVMEKAAGASNSCHIALLKSIDAKISLLKTRYDCGIQVPRRNMPRKYVELYGVTNLWKVDLYGYWRMVYTLNQPQRGENEVGIICIWLDVLDLIDHKRYDKIFGYRKK